MTFSTQNSEMFEKPFGYTQQVILNCAHSMVLGVASVFCIARRATDQMPLSFVFMPPPRAPSLLTPFIL